MKTMKKISWVVMVILFGLLSQGFLEGPKGVFFANWGDQLFVAKDYKGAFEKYKSAADLDNGYACFRLFTMYYAGRGVAQDEALALAALEKAVKLENDDAQVLMGEHLLMIPKERDRGIELLKKAAEKENVLAYMQLSLVYSYGVGVKKDLKKAQEYVRLANAHGANISLSEKTVPNNEKTAIKFSQKDLISKIQNNLKRLGFYTGTVDGYTGPMTNKSIAAFQKTYGYPVDVQIREELLEQTEKAIK